MPISRDAGKPRAGSPEPDPERPVPGSAGAEFGEDGPEVVDDQAGLTEEQKLDEAVEDLAKEKD